MSAIISCGFIKKTYFAEEYNKFKTLVLYGFLLITFVIACLSAQVIHTILRSKHTSLELSERNSQLKIVKRSVQV